MTLAHLDSVLLIAQTVFVAARSELKSQNGDSYLPIGVRIVERRSLLKLARGGCGEQFILLLSLLLNWHFRVGSQCPKSGVNDSVLCVYFFYGGWLLRAIL